MKGKGKKAKANVIAVTTGNPVSAYSVTKAKLTQEFYVSKSAASADGERFAKTDSVATIVFIDNKFSRCDFYAKNPYSREEWKMLWAIETIISNIEEGLK